MYRKAERAAKIAEIVRSVQALMIVVAAAFTSAPRVAQAADDVMSFQRIEARYCPAQGCVLAKGRIGPNTHRAFAQARRDLKIDRGAQLLLSSPGGDLVDGLKLGLQIRKAGLHTRVADGSSTPLSSGICASACAYAFLGGVVRQVDDAARVGIHQFRDPEGGFVLNAAETQQLVGLVADYLSSVGANFRFETLALRTPAGQVHWLSPYELNALSVVKSEEEALAGPSAADDGPRRATPLG